MKRLSMLLIFLFWTSVIYPQNGPWCPRFQNISSAPCCPENEPEFVASANAISDQSKCAGGRFSA